MLADDLPQVLRSTLQAAAHQRRRQEAVRLAWPVACAGMSLTLVGLLLARSFPLAYPTTLLAAGGAVTALALVGILVFVWLRPNPRASTARLLDRRLNLEERLSTALELKVQPAATPAQIVEAQIADAIQHVEGLDPLRVFPIRWSRDWLAVAGTLLGAIIVILLAPNGQTAVLQEQARIETIVEEQVAQLEAIQAELLADQALLETSPGRELLASLDELISELQAASLSREEGLAALSAAEQSLVSLQAAAANQTPTLNNLAQTFSQFESTQDLAEAIRQRDLTRAAEALASAGNNALAEAQAAQELATALREAAQAAQAAGDAGLAETLAQAAAALEQSTAPGGDPQVAQEALAQAAEALANAGQQLAGQEVIAEALANIQQAQEQLAAGNAGQGQAEGAATGDSIGSADGQTVGGAGREDPGPGAEGVSADQGAPDRMSTGNGPNEGRAGEYESLYAPEHLGGQGGPLVMPDAPEVEQGLPVGNAAVDPNQDAGEPLVPYNQVYGQYADAAGQALEKNYIPLGMKDFVRQYFGALEPGN